MGIKKIIRTGVFCLYSSQLYSPDNKTYILKSVAKQTKSAYPD